MQNHEEIYARLYHYADTMQIIDTHEHLNPHQNYMGEQPDVLCDYFSHYIDTDLENAGMPKQAIQTIRDYKIPILDRFRLLEPYLARCKNTSYYRSLAMAASKIHGIADISLDTIEELNAKFIQATTSPNYQHHIMHDLCHIERVIDDFWIEDMRHATTDLFVPAWHQSAFVLPRLNDIALSQFDMATASFEQYCEHTQQYFLKQVADGMKALKNGMAYYRSLYYEDVDIFTAKELFNAFTQNYRELKKESPTMDLQFPKPLQDYMMHFIFQVADDHRLVLQVHTGLQGGMAGNLENSNPMLLKNLFTKYPNLTFTLFHMGYPYERELMALAKTHANVYIDLCWAHIISPYAAKNAFYEMLDVLPYTKILAFGGDYLFYDGVVGHITLAKQNICTVLTQKVTNGECDIALAETILQSVLHDNAKWVFNL